MLNQLPALVASAALAPSPLLALVVKLEDLAGVIITTVVFTVFGLIAFVLAFTIIVKATPFSIRKELEEDQNVAIAVVIGAVIIGIAMIVAAAILG